VTVALLSASSGSRSLIEYDLGQVGSTKKAKIDSSGASQDPGAHSLHHRPEPAIIGD
jgi:hypothetical protein